MAPSKQLPPSHGHGAQGIPIVVLGELSDKSLLFQEGQHGSILSLSAVTDVDAVRSAEAGTVLHKVSHPSRQLAQISTEYSQGLDAAP